MIGIENEDSKINGIYPCLYLKRGSPTLKARLTTGPRPIQNQTSASGGRAHACEAPFVLRNWAAQVVAKHMKLTHEAPFVLRN